jgi:hypothetical protein
LDAWSAAGLSGALTALGVLVVIGRKWLQAARHFVMAPVMSRLALVALVAGAIFFVRAFTSGGGLPHPTQWMLVAYFLAVAGGLAESWKQRTRYQGFAAQAATTTTDRTKLLAAPTPLR